MHLGILQEVSSVSPDIHNETWVGCNTSLALHNVFCLDQKVAQVASALM